MGMAKTKTKTATRRCWVKLPGCPRMEIEIETTGSDAGDDHAAFEAYKQARGYTQTSATPKIQWFDRLVQTKKAKDLEEVGELLKQVSSERDELASQNAALAAQVDQLKACIEELEADLERLEHLKQYEGIEERLAKLEAAEKKPKTSNAS